MTPEKTKTLLKGRQKVINGFESKIFPIEKQEKQGKGIKITNASKITNSTCTSKSR